jgi:hypothetical protein
MAADHERSFRRRAACFVGVPIAAALAALAALHAIVPEYLLRQGFPLDDAWIHAVYARELARSLTLAYNPGIPATGETAPLWAVMLAPVHGVAGSPAAIVALTKALGFVLHAASAAVIAFSLWNVSEGSDRPLVFAAALVGAHPDFVAASVSGMEVPLATLVIAAVVACTLCEAAVPAAVIGAAAVAGRPETLVFAVVFPVLFWVRRPALACRLAAATGAGAALAFIAIGLRNRAVSGMFLPATFHAKVNVTSPFDLTWQVSGFRGLIGQLPVIGLDFVLATIVLLTVALIWRTATTPLGRAAAAMCLAGLVYCSASFFLVRPLDPSAFYYHRYVLPGLFAVVAAVPLLAHEGLRTLPPRTYLISYAVASMLLAGMVVQTTPSRYRRLSNDARNIDDVQVAFGRSLAAARPSDNAWVVDAGAARFFGQPFIVDLIGLNTPEILGPHAQSYLDRHEPRYLDMFPGWSKVDTHEPGVLPAKSFETSTSYTVTSYLPMRQHVLVRCEPAGTKGRMTVRGRPFMFRCAP